MLFQIVISSWMIHQSIGAVNTIIRRSTDGKLVGYNTDCEASITAIEDALKGTHPDTRKFPILYSYMLINVQISSRNLARWFGAI